MDVPLIQMFVGMPRKDSVFPLKACVLLQEIVISKYIVR